MLVSEVSDGGGRSARPLRLLGQRCVTMEEWSTRKRVVAVLVVVAVAAGFFVSCAVLTAWAVGA